MPFPLIAVGAPEPPCPGSAPCEGQPLATEEGAVSVSHRDGERLVWRSAAYTHDATGRRIRARVHDRRRPAGIEGAWQADLAPRRPLRTGERYTLSVEVRPVAPGLSTAWSVPIEVRDRGEPVPHDAVVRGSTWRPVEAADPAACRLGAPVLVVALDEEHVRPGDRFDVHVPDEDGWSFWATVAASGSSLALGTDHLCEALNFSPRAPEGVGELRIARRGAPTESGSTLTIGEAPVRAER